MPSLKNLMGETFEPLGPPLPKEVPQPETPKWEPMPNHPGYERRGNEVRRADGPKELLLPLNLDPVDPYWVSLDQVDHDDLLK